jgi:putative ATP-binding cassette transporter
VVEEARAARLFVETRYATGEIIVQALKFSLFGSVIFLVPFLADQTATTVFQIITVVLFSLSPFEAIVTKYPDYVHARICFIRVMELHDKLAGFAGMPQAVGDSALAFETIEMSGVLATHGARETSSFQLGPLDFSLKHGETTFIVGDNGSGKTTFLSVLTGLLEPVQGHLAVDGASVPIDRMEQYRALFSTVFTDFHLFRRLYGLLHVDGAMADEVLGKVGLSGITRLDGNEFTRIDLSAGQRRRLALAVALLESRKIIVLDEFVADQDPEHRRYFFEELIPEFKAMGKTVIVTTHDLKWISSCDRLITFEDGRIKSIRHFADGRELTASEPAASAASL